MTWHYREVEIEKRDSLIAKAKEIIKEAGYKVSSVLKFPRGELIKMCLGASQSNLHSTAVDDANEGRKVS